MTPPTTWQAGHVSRWHTNQHHVLRNSHDTNHQHSARVALLLWHLWPDCPRDAILYALGHDLAESVTGDMSGETKRANSDISARLSAIETAWMCHAGFPLIDQYWIDRVKLCDMLDAILWAWSVDPALMDREDWQKQIDDTITYAYGLGRGIQVEEMIG